MSEKFVENKRQLKILGIKLKYLGDVALTTPALRALRDAYPQAELHVLVPEEAAPILRHIPWIDKVWGLRRKRGSRAIKDMWPQLKQLRAEKFDKLVDFAGNDRGAIVSLIIGAKEKLANKGSRGFLGRSKCYHQAIPKRVDVIYEPWHDLYLLQAGWGIKMPEQANIELAANPELAEKAAALLPSDCVLCHISSNQPKKQWPLERWGEFAMSAKQSGIRVVFSAGVSKREQDELGELQKSFAGIECLSPVKDLELFMAVLQRVKVFVSGDTGPLHFAVGLQVPTVSIFGASLAANWAPEGKRHRVLLGEPCRCVGALKVCASDNPCMMRINSHQVLENVRQLLWI